MYSAFSAISTPRELPMSSFERHDIDQHFEELQQLLVRHRQLTGHYLKDSIGEIGEYIVAKEFNLKLVRLNKAGYDAIDKHRVRYQIKSTMIERGAKRRGGFSNIKLSLPWEYIYFCMLTEKYVPISIHRISRKELAAISDHSVVKHNFMTSAVVCKHATLVYGEYPLRKLYGVV